MNCPDCGRELELETIVHSKHDSSKDDDYREDEYTAYYCIECDTVHIPSEQECLLAW